MNLSHNEVSELLGAQAIGALPADEAEQVDIHVAQCDVCRTELRELEQGALSLAGEPPEPPDGVWDEIAKSIGRSSSSDMPVSLLRVVRRRNRFVQGTAIFATAAAVAAIVLGVWASSLHGQVDHLKGEAIQTQLQGQVADALEAPDHRVVTLESPTGAELARAVITKSGTGFLVPGSMPALLTDRTYQLWALSGGSPVSLGILGANPQISVFKFETQMTALMVTAEPAGGVQSPTLPVLGSGTITSVA